MVEFRVKKGEVLFNDGEDFVQIYYLQRTDGIESQWSDVLELHLEGGRSWGDQIDFLFRNKMRDEFLLHISGFGYWGDAEYYRSTDGGLTWEPTANKRDPDPSQYVREELAQAG